MSCSGDGMCIQQCIHKRHNGYCPSNCQYNCQPVECHNFFFCGQKRPQCILSCRNGICGDCKYSYGKMKKLNVKGDCCVCIEHKEMIELSCNHTICLECWKQMSDTPKNGPLKCPLCRNPIFK